MLPLFPVLWLVTTRSGLSGYLCDAAWAIDVPAARRLIAEGQRAGTTR
jgi:hypothetical protein